MIQIEHLRLHLPAVYQHRAVSIVRKLGDLLAKEQVSQDISLDSVSLPPLQLTGYYSDEELALKIARQISNNFRGGKL